MGIICPVIPLELTAAAITSIVFIISNQIFY